VTAIREQATVDIEHMSAWLVAGADPTASRELRALERALACLPACATIAMRRIREVCDCGLRAACRSGRPAKNLGLSQGAI
jgi:hypothetical protein